MAVNLKTAKALGFAVPPSIMLRTDEVIRDSTGHSGRASDVDDVRAHGKDERVGVKAFFEGGEYLYRLVKRLEAMRSVMREPWPPCGGPVR